VQHWDRYVILDDVELAIDDQRHNVFVQGGGAAAVVERAGLASRALTFDDVGVAAAC